MATFCAGCGNTLTEGDRFCRVCGKDTAATAGTVPSTGVNTPSVNAETSGKAVGSLICGLLFIFPFAFLAAIVLGHMALSEIRKSGGRLKGEGLAIAGLILGYVWVAAIPVVLIIAAIAIPNLLRTRIAANELSAVTSIGKINTAEITYSAEHEGAGFTCSLGDLSSLIDSRLAFGQKSGYEFKLSECKADAKGTVIAYHVVAYPVQANTTGARAFCSNESAVIWVDDAGSAQNCLSHGEPLH